MVVEIRVIACRVGKPPEVEQLQNSIEAMQRLVGGALERVALGEAVALICKVEDDIGEAPNRYLPLTGGHGLIRGDFFIVAHGGDEFASMTDDQVATWTARAAGWQPAG